MKNQTQDKNHYAWKILIACIAIKIGTGGASAAAMANFITPIVNELGCQVSQLTLYTSVNAIAMALLYTTASKVLTTSKRIGLVMGLASVAEVVGLLLMSTYTSVYMFYFSGLLIGIAQSFTGFVAIPILLNMWFRKNNGTVLGITVAVNSGVGVLYSLLTAQLITHLGWRTSYVVLAVMAAVLTLPVVFKFIKSPEEVGCLPYGADESGEAKGAAVSTASGWGITKKQAFGSAFLYVAWTACVMYSYASGVAGYITPFATMELGQSTNFGAFCGIAMSLGGVVGGVILGRINDKFGVKAGLIWGAVTTTAGYGVMLLSFQNPIFTFPAAFFVGLGSGMYMVQCPLLARSIVGIKHYPEIWSLMMMINSLIGGGLYASIGLFYDKLGSYRGAFIMGAAFYIGAMFLGILSVKMSHKRVAKLAAE